MPEQTARKPCIGILETGRPPVELGEVYRDYPEMAVQWLSGVDATFTRFAVLDNQFPADVKDADLWLIMGSKFGVYDGDPWISRLEEFVRATHLAGGRMFGICFGHQVIAKALGGTVIKSPKGWGVGVYRYDVTENWPPLFGPRPDALTIQAFHQDQVVSPPPGARLLATSEFCPYAAFWYPGFAVTVQGHPEFSRDYVANLLEGRRESVVPGSVVDAARKRETTETNAEQLAGLLGAHWTDF